MRELTKRALIIATCVAAGCDVETLLNQTATFGPAGGASLAGAPIASGLRDTFAVFIENNTSFRAIFTVGSFDNTDERSTPVFFQFSTDSQLTPANASASATLEGNTDTGIMILPCARVFSIGGTSLVNLVDERPGGLGAQIDEAGLIDGVGFSSAGISTDDANIPREGIAPGFDALLGVDFNCGSLMVFSLDFAPTGPNRFQVNLIDVFPAGRPDDDN